MRTSRGGNPLAKSRVVLVLKQLVRLQDTRDVVADACLVRILKITCLEALHVSRKKQQQNSDCQLYLAALEEDVRARRVNTDSALFKSLGKVASVSVLDRFEEECDLVVVVDCAALLKLQDKVANGIAPIVLVIADLDDGRRTIYAFPRGFYRLLEAIVLPVESKAWASGALHPLVVERNDPWVGTVVVGKGNAHAIAIAELVRKLQDVSNRGTSKTVETLVVIPDNTDVMAFLGKKEGQLFLDIIRVLILIDHDILDLVMYLGENVRMPSEQLVRLKLDMSEIEPVLFGQHLVVRFGYLGISERDGVIALEHLINVDEFLRHRVGDAANLLARVPHARFLWELGEMFKRFETTPVVLKYEILLVEGISNSVVLSNVRVFDMLFDKP